MLSWNLPVLSPRFQEQHLLPAFKGKETRCRVFNPARLFHSLIQLIGGGNHEGYSIALMKSFSGKNASLLPHRSSLCRARKKISFTFFATALKRLLKRCTPGRKQFLGLFIYAIDGQMLRLPRSKEVLSHGFTGRATSKYRDTYYPRGFLTHAYDVLSGVTQDFRFGPKLHEQADALTLVQGFEPNSLTLYDRLYFCRKLIRAHFQKGSYFLFRCRKNACKPIEEFYNSKDTTRTVTYAGCVLRLIKVRPPRSVAGEVSVFATNLPEEFLRPQLIRKLYRLRWEVETSFLELTGTTQAEQWHSKTLNGVLQELYCRFWLINYTKIQVLELQGRSKTKKRVKQKPENPLRDEYRKPCFKLLYAWVVLHFSKLLRRTSHIWEHFERLTKMSTERRVHWKRSYPREIKLPASPYPYNNTRWYWEP